MHECVLIYVYAIQNLTFKQIEILYTWQPAERGK